MNLPNVFRTLVFALALTPALLSCDKDDDKTTATPAVDTTAEKTAIQQLLTNYGTALNASNAATVTTLFAQDGVFAAPGSPTATGQTQVRAAFDGLFSAVTLTLAFTPANITVVTSDYAFATSTSSGTQLVKPSGPSAKVSFREQWVLVKESGQWKIARYIFNAPQ
ncbi:conserved hypothetical protein [Hymenobacter gelipurpurascens]|uniref:SnoaL-like domain-containing protein n=1 Tax=Hymenobacter gelipurpurascens TaxID=89968 RepID=A0A212TI05_9BACT|nr:SgcJ/EcaC family oxidoreductase [Hymenobacter gelipurpurascens]SNC65456.1 conserved hypothetical protein [Hymenobacter gelipurpurascens]